MCFSATKGLVRNWRHPHTSIPNPQNDVVTSLIAEDTAIKNVTFADFYRSDICRRTLMSPSRKKA